MLTPSQLRNRRGQVLVLTPVLLLSLVAVLALAIDIGAIAVEKARMQNAADAACLAAVAVLADQYSAGSAEADARAAATEAAEQVFAANTTEAGLNLEFGIWDEDGAFAAIGPESRATVVRATAARNSAAPGGPLALVFAPVVGVDACEVSAIAGAELDSHITAVLGGLAPFAVPRDSIPGIGEEFGFYPGGSNGNGQDKGQEQTAPGNWGLLNLDGGPNTTPELIDWIENGYPGKVEIDNELGYVWIEGTPGWRAALEGSLQSKVGEQLTVCVYDEVTEQGSNAQYRVVGFLRLTLTYADLTGQNAEVRGRVEGMQSVHDVLTGDGGWESPNMVKLQLRL